MLSLVPGTGSDVYRRVALERAWRCSLGSSLEEFLGHDKQAAAESITIGET